MRLTSPLGIVVYMVIICLLTIIFSMVMLSPGRTADDLLKSGDSIQDIYAGKPTKRYLIGTVLSFSVISSIIICICQGGPLFLQFGGYVDASLAMLPCSIMMTTGLWISLYREARCTGIWTDIIHSYSSRRFELRIRRNHNAIFYTGMV